MNFIKCYEQFLYIVLFVNKVNDFYLNKTCEVWTNFENFIVILKDLNFL
jgi:hypothetical protein